MKYLMTLVAILTLMSCDKGGFFNGETYPADEAWRLEASGLDIRVYEFTPRTSPQKQCIFAAGDRKGGLVCFDKGVL